MSSVFCHDTHACCFFSFIVVSGEYMLMIIVRLCRVLNRDIEVGMEICHSYIHENAPVEERITELRRSYNFECNCERCGVEKST